MFISPSTTLPQSVTDAASFLDASNAFIEQCRAFQREQFQAFWRPNGTLRTPQEINAVLTAMDAASPGQSAMFFNAAKELVALILAIVPDGMGQSDWMPPYEYTVDPQTFSLRVIE